MATNNPEDKKLYHDLGYLTKAVEDIGDKLTHYTSKTCEQYEHTQQRLTKIEDQLSFYKTVARTVKVIGLSLVLLVTAQWHEFIKLFTR